MLSYEAPRDQGILCSRAPPSSTYLTFSGMEAAVHYVTHVQRLGGKGKFEYGLSVTAAVKTRKTPQK